MQNNSEELVGLNVAILAKDLGFDWPVLDYFISKNSKWEEKEASFRFNYNKEKYFISRPSQSLLYKWLRDTHKISIQIFDYENEEGNLSFTFKSGDLGSEKDDLEFSECETYEEAFEDALTHVLTILKHNLHKSNFEDFIEKYKPELTEHGEVAIYSGTGVEKLKEAVNKNLLWTIITGSNNLDYIVKGWHYVDRIGHLIATVPYEKGSENDLEEYLY